MSVYPKASARKLKPTPPRPRSLHERILEEIKAERKLRPVSPDEIRRSRLGKHVARFDLQHPQKTSHIRSSNFSHICADVTEEKLLLEKKK